LSGSLRGAETWNALRPNPVCEAVTERYLRSNHHQVELTLASHINGVPRDIAQQLGAQVPRRGRGSSVPWQAPDLGHRVRLEQTERKGVLAPTTADDENLQKLSHRQGPLMTRRPRGKWGWQRHTAGSLGGPFCAPKCRDHETVDKARKRD